MILITRRRGLHRLERATGAGGAEPRHHRGRLARRPTASGATSPIIPPAEIVPARGAGRLFGRPSAHRGGSASGCHQRNHRERRRSDLGHQRRANPNVYGAGVQPTTCRFIYASSAATYGDGTHGFMDDGSLQYLQTLRPLNLYAWTKHAFDLWVAQQIAGGAKRPAALGWAEILQRLRAQRIPQGQDDLRREGQARRYPGRRPATAVPLRPAGPTRWRAEARLHLGRRRGGCDRLAC